MRVNGRRFFSAWCAGATISKRRFWQIAILTAAGSVAAAAQADAAAMFYWQDSDPGYYRPLPPIQPRKPKVRRPSAKTAAAMKETNAKPHGPLIITVSIEQQKLRIYDANGLFAESPVSTGMKGHSTPMGVFSVIQKHKMHRSNIYSGAPMPYMQRITWSGVALHAGVLPGYPHAAGLCGEDVELDQDGRAGHHHARPDHAGQFLPPVAGCAEGRATASPRRRSKQRRPRGQGR
jgi:hypothetical protein